MFWLNNRGFPLMFVGNEVNNFAKYCFVLDFLFANSYHKLSCIEELPCASWTTNISCPKSCEL